MKPEQSGTRPAKPLGAVLVVGGGIGGMQSALDLANSGFKVYLVEQAPAIGGRMAQLDKTFPTNDCSMCIVSPKLVEVGRHPNIELKTLSQVLDVRGEVGDFQAEVKRLPRYIDLEKCTGCGQCEIVCPVTFKPHFGPSPGKAGNKKDGPSGEPAKSVTLPFTAPLVGAAPDAWRFTVDTERCKKCGICFRECPAQAILWTKGEPAEVKQADCIGCGMCYASCPAKFSAIAIGGAPAFERGLGAALLARHDAIKRGSAKTASGDCLRCGMCVLMCDKVMGAGALKLTTAGVEVRRDLCRACGACISVCPAGFLEIGELTDKTPVPLRSAYNARLAPRKPVYIHYAQAVPRAPVIEPESCVRLATGACGICQSLCDAGAIDYSQTESVERLAVGSVILAPGFEPFPAEEKAEYGYGVYPNVVTSLELERLLSASGPTEGRIARPSDGRHPRRIAFIQCVGSRDASRGRDYCSSVCCMYATKEAVIAREHDKSIEASIFYIDLRAFGKGFDDYVTRAREQYGVRYVRAMVSRIFEDPVTGDLELRYVDEAGEKVSESFELVVLSVGLQIPEDTKSLARRLGVALDEFGFASTDEASPLAASRPGIFVCGVFNGPKDIPESVSEASGAAGAAGGQLAAARGSLVEPEVFPTEIVFEPGVGLRIGVFICHCGINIAGVVDVAEVTRYALTLPGVVHAEHLLYTCSQDTQEKLRGVIEHHGLNRVVVAACSPRTHEPIFQQTIRQAGLNKYLFEMANIRDQCSWVHQDDHPGATEKSKRLVRMAVANAGQTEALLEQEFPVISNLLVVGGGLAGMVASIEAARQGFKVYLVEQDAELGGQLKHLRWTIEGRDAGELLASLRERVEGEPLITVFTGSAIVDHKGFIGNFETEIMTPAGVSRTVRHGATIVATGGREARPAIYGLGERERVMTQTDFERSLAEVPQPGITSAHVVMIQCAGSRDERLPYCSRVCCNQAVKNALLFKQHYPRSRVDILYRDVRAYGLGELQYRAARRAGVNFIRYEPGTNDPEVRFDGERIEVVLLDPSIRRRVRLSPELLVLSTGVVPPENGELATMLRVPRNAAGFFIEAHAKLRPVDFASEGLFLAGTAHYPKSISETISQASAAVARAATILSKEKLRMSGVVSRVNPEHCAVCLTCVRACPYGVPAINSQHAAEINPALCQGCGICVAECPAKAIGLGRYKDANLLAKVEALRETVQAAS